MPPYADSARTWPLLCVLGALLASFGGVEGTHAGPTKSDRNKEAAYQADIVMLGDSQLSFGSGPTMLSFLSNLDQRCARAGLGKTTLKRLRNLRIGIMGVRATGLQMWLSRVKRRKRMICVKDPTGLVNASAYGVMRTRHKWVQIGESRAHQFCKPRKSALELLLAPDAYRPKLVILNFLGLSAYRWASLAKARRDAKELALQLPNGTKCLYATTAPTYRAKINRPRHIGQRNIAKALDEIGRCDFVAGLTKQTVAAMQGKARYYYRHANGRVKDPYHPNPAGARRFLRLKRNAYCRSIAKALVERKQTRSEAARNSVALKHSRPP